MSIVVVPGQFHSEPHPAGKLASTLLSVTVAGMADPARFRRGKTYVAQHAVTRLEITPGTLKASVSGSRPTPYQVIVSVRTEERIVPNSAEALRAQLTRLTPDAGDLMVSCTCPDFDDPCKHAVAAILAFANELVTRPELLVQWRCAPDGEEPTRPKVGSRAKPSERHLRAVAELPSTKAAPVDPWAAPEWQAFLGALPPAEPAVPREAARIGRAMLGTIDLAAIVRSAIDTIHPPD